MAWALLLPPVLRQWKTPTIGISFVVGVATDGLALLSATLAGTFRAGWLVTPAALFLLLGLALYGFTLARFDLRQLISGHGDHWIAGGALAIAALSAAKVTEAARTLDRLRHLHHILGPSTFVLWCLAIVWLPVGVGVAGLYLGGVALWPGVLVGDLLANDYTALPVGSALGQTFGNVLEVLVATLLLRRLVRAGSPLQSVGGVARMVAAIAAGTAVSATVGSLAQWFGGVDFTLDAGKTLH